MASSLNSLMDAAVPAQYLTPKFKALVESVRVRLRSDPSTTLIRIDPKVAYRYRGNFTGYLLSLRIMREDHLFIMRMNDIGSIHDFDETVESLYIPSQDVLKQIKAMYRQSSGK